MNLFVDREFLVNFEIEFNFNDVRSNTDAQKVFYNIMAQYPDITLYTNYTSFKECIGESHLIELFSNLNTQINFNIDFDSFFNEMDQVLMRTVVFTEKSYDWHLEVADKGGICFNYASYQNVIHDILDSTEGFSDFSDDGFKFDWELFSKLKVLPISSVIIDDPYILKDANGQRIKDNLIELMKVVLKDNQRKVEFLIYTDVVQTKSDIKERTEEVVCAENRRDYVFRGLTNYVKHCLLVKNKQQSRIEQSGLNFVEHDRYIYTDFCITSLQKGFNQMPFVRNNSKLETKTIFEKPYYRQLNNHLRELKKYTEKLQKEKFGPHEFKVLPKEEKIINRLLSSSSFSV